MNKPNGDALNKMFSELNKVSTAYEQKKEEQEQKPIQQALTLDAVNEPPKKEKSVKKEIKTNSVKVERKNKHVDLYLTETTKEFLFNDAKRLNISINEYIENLLRERK